MRPFILPIRVRHRLENDRRADVEWRVGHGVGHDTGGRCMAFWRDDRRQRRDDRRTCGQREPEATRGNLTIGSGSTVSAAGVSKQFFDLVQYAPAGAITLTADAGTVDAGRLDA